MMTTPGQTARSLHLVPFLIFILLFNLPEPTFAQTTTSSINFVFPDRGGATNITSGTQSSLSVGYAQIIPNLGSVTPAGVAVYGFRQNGILVSETGVPASSLMQTGRIFAESSATLNTGIAIANPNTQSAVVSFYFTDSTGSDFGSGSITIPANGQISRFLSEAPFNGGMSLQGTFSFSSSLPVGVIALRGLMNERSEFLTTTLPVVDTSTNISGTIETISQFADGGGWATQVVLVNPGNVAESGIVQFVGQGTSIGVASTVAMTVNGQTGVSFPYSVPPRSSAKLITGGLAQSTVVGSITVTASTGSSLPSSMAVFSFRPEGVTVSEAGVPAQSATSFRMFAETTSAGSAAGTIQTGIAVANTDSAPTSVTFQLYRLDGTFTGLTASEQLAGKGQVAAFFHELFPTVQFPFNGIVRIVSAGPAISAVGLRGRYNERNDFLITTTPPFPETTTGTSAITLFPQIADSGGYTTQFILFSGIVGQVSSGILSFFSQIGTSLFLTIQ